MAKTEKINVHFINRPPYDGEWPSTDINLGQITSAQLNTILAKFKKNAPGPHACIKTMDIEFHDTMDFSWPHDSTLTQSRNLDLSNMFYFYDMDKKSASCMIGKKRPRTEGNMVRTCAHNLRCGKCKDEFIRRTLGAALFPQFYAKDKQK